MAATDRTSADALLKDFYLPRARRILNDTVFLLSQIEKNTEDIDGREAVLYIETGRNEGVGARGEGGILPVAGTQRGVNSRVPVKHQYGRIEVSGPVMRSTKTDRGSFDRVVDRETKGMVRDVRNDVNRQLFGTSNGVIATVAAAGPTNALTIQNPTPVKIRQLRKNMRIDIHTPPNFTKDEADSRTITATDGAGGFTIDGAAVTVEAGDTVTREDSGGTLASTGQKEVTGLATQIAATGALFGVDPAADPDWAAYVDSSGGAVSLLKFEKAAMEVNVRSGETLDIWITSDGVLREVSDELTGLKRFPNSNQLKGGFSGVDITTTTQGDGGANQVTMVHEKDCPYNDAFGITSSRFQWYMMSDWDWMDMDGAIWARSGVGPNGVDAYEATMYVDAELATDGRNAHALVSGITVAV